MNYDEEPPPIKIDLCRTFTTGICPCASIRRTTRLGTLDFIYHLPSPNSASRFRNDRIVLETI